MTQTSSISFWNKLVALQLPSFNDLRIFGWSEQSALVFEHAPELHMLTDNILVTGVIGKTPGADANVVSISLILVPDYFGAASAATPSRLDDLRYAGLKVTHSADVFLDHLRLTTDTPLHLKSRERTFSILLDNTMELRFDVADHLDLEPAQSKLVSLTYYYRSGRTVPVELAVVSDAGA